MSEKKIDYHIVQIGQQNWQDNCQIPENIAWYYVPSEEIETFVARESQHRQDYEEEQKSLRKLAEEGPKKLPKAQIKPPIHYTALVLTDQDYPEAIQDLSSFFEVYAIFYPETGAPKTTWTKEFLRQKMAQMVDMSEPQTLVDKVRKIFYNGQYGAKLPVSELQVTDNFNGKIRTNGNSDLCLNGRFGEGDEFQQVAHFNYNVPYYAPTPLHLFFDHRISEGVQTKISVQLIPSGATDYIAQEWEFDGNQGKEELVIEADFDGYLWVSMYAKGEGDLHLGPCHYRFGRLELGEFILGGQRFVDDEQQEFMYYFDPQDFKPPFCVYFSGFRTAEGFEGYWMMKSMKCPFMLICDPRLDGGSFYIGSQQFEDKLVEVIQEKLDFLGFDSSQLILSGLSMGTFGAAYYGARLSPYGIVIGKPVLSLGEVALKEKVIRPAGFPTSLDLLNRYGGLMNEEGAQTLDDRFWSQFAKGDFSKTKFAIAYMKDDDYDGTSFGKILEHTKDTTAVVIGRGWQGRHLDGGSGPTNWFLKQYYDFLKHDFGREY